MVQGHYVALQGQFLISPQNGPSLKNMLRGYYVALQGQFFSPENGPFSVAQGAYSAVHSLDYGL